MRLFKLLGLALALTMLLGQSNAGDDKKKDKPGGKKHTVVMEDDVFKPKSITVEVGDTIVFVNKGNKTHAATVEDDKDANAFDTGDVAPGASSKPVEMKKAGKVPYFCGHHSGMEGTITVNAKGKGAEKRSTSASAVKDDEPKDKPAKETPVIRELNAKGVKFDEKGKAANPAVVKNAKDLAKFVDDEAERDRIKKDVNWDKEYVVVFSWGGSGGDKFSPDVQKGKEGSEVVFTYTRGLTRDYRMHMKLYAVQSGVTWKVK